jgi:transcriptional regulator with XRE-family HTH domain
MRTRMNRGTEEDLLPHEVFLAALKLQLAELGYMLPPGSVPDEERFGLLLKTVRRYRGYSQGQLAERSDVTETTISRLERGRHAAQGRTIVDLARALEVSPEFLDPDRVFTEWVDYAAQVRKQLGELLGRGVLKDLELERAFSEWDEDQAAVRNRLGPAAVRNRLGYLLAREILAEKERNGLIIEPLAEKILDSRQNRAAIEQEKELT